MASVKLGNTHVIEVLKDDDGSEVTHDRADLGHQVCEAAFDSDLVPAEISVHVQDFWKYHSSDPIAWVESDDDNLAQFLALGFSAPVGRPSDWVTGPQEDN